MEKGAYRLRAPRKIIAPTESDIRRPLHANGFTNLMIILLVLLASGAISCFGAAYYLFTSRWASAAFPRPVRYGTNEESPVLVFELHHNSDAVRNDPQEKYLAYLPHSGFHNQRIALENALTLSRLLNRTLLVPPIRLGRKPLRYVKFENLIRLLSLSGKEGLLHCPKAVQTALPTECLDFFDYTSIPWEWLLDLSLVRSHQRLIQRWNMSSAWLHDELGISQADTWTLADLEAYHYRFLDSLDRSSVSQNKYSESVYIPTLARSTHRLIHIGTLFGSSRLRLRRQENVRVRTDIRRSMTFANSFLVEAADRIAHAMGGSYLGAHIRIGDGEFLERSDENTRLLWWKLVCSILRVSVNDALVLEREVRAGGMDKAHLEVPRIPNDLTAGHNELPQPPGAPLSLQCRHRTHSVPHLTPLNTPLFISTDAKEPLTNPLLSAFLRTFPCTFFLNDFASHAIALDRLQSGYDGLMLKPFLEPFLDAMVVGKAWVAVGTEGSTFSRFVEDVLWRTYHGLEIVQRG
jgi:hypothetical protein